MSYFERMQVKYKVLQDKEDVLILSIETSCDDTSLAIVKNGRNVLATLTSSQIDIHALFGGVVPEVASRNHLLTITPLFKQLLQQAKIKQSQIDCVAVTYGAGLVGALMVGVNFAKSLAFALDVPLIKVNHIKAHISANYITHENLMPPFLALVVSGGHTALLRIDDYFNHKVLATTKDDAVGEAYDKVAKVLGLGYPGGPVIDKLSKKGQANISFVKPFSKSEPSFSYSGLKTAVINHLHMLTQKNQKPAVEDVCASFQKQAIAQLVDKTVYMAKKHSFDKVVVAGGVSANSALREGLANAGSSNEIEVFFPDLKYCTDNASMVGSEAYFLMKNNKNLADLHLTAEPMINLKYVN